VVLGNGTDHHKCETAVVNIEKSSDFARFECFAALWQG
jgi:hypothetical protein